MGLSSVQQEFKKLADQAIGTAQTTVPHGLGYTPDKVLITPKGSGIVYESAAADATNVYLTASAAVSADIYVS